MRPSLMRILFAHFIPVCIGRKGLHEWEVQLQHGHVLAKPVRLHSQQDQWNAGRSECAPGCHHDTHAPRPRLRRHRTLQSKHLLHTSPVVELVRATLRASLVLKAFYAEGYTEIDTTSTYQRLGNTALAGWTFAVGAGVWERSFEAVALAATYCMTQLTENGKFLVVGYIVDRVTVTHLRWWWLSLPVGLFAATVVLLAVTVRMSRNTPAWRNSILPLVFTSRLREEGGLWDISDKQYMKCTARSMAVGVESRGWNGADANEGEPVYQAGEGFEYESRMNGAAGV